MSARNVLAAALLLAALLAPAGAEEKAPQRTVDLVICLDTSGSMEGLIDSARQKIWAIVNDLALAKPTPRLRVGLLSYGNDGHDPAAGWVSLETDLTEDLDLVSAKLFAYRTNGGTELVGRVLQAAVDRMSWTPGDGLKIIVVAGNESADQDREVPYKDVCKRAIERGIMVNSIYCVRAEAADIAEGWRQVALLADGHYATIDQNQGTVTIATPFDARLAELSTGINDTFVPMGEVGKKAQRLQREQDALAEGMNADAAAQRARSKGTALYVAQWSLVDAVRNGDVKLEDVKDEDLPEELRGKTLEEKRAYIDAKWEERAKIQQEIGDLHRQRLEYIQAELAKQAKEDDQSFDAAVRRAIRAQAAKKGYAFEE